MSNDPTSHIVKKYPIIKCFGLYYIITNIKEKHIYRTKNILRNYYSNLHHIYKHNFDKDNSDEISRTISLIILELNNLPRITNICKENITEWQIIKNCCSDNFGNFDNLMMDKKIIDELVEIDNEFDKQVNDLRISLEKHSNLTSINIEDLFDIKLSIDTMQYVSRKLFMDFKQILR